MQIFKIIFICGINIWYISFFLSISSHPNGVIKNNKIYDKKEGAKF
jgi:hypothetical protein